MSARTPDPTTLTLHEVAEELGVHYMTAYRYVRLGMLPARREGRGWVIDREDLEAFRTPASEPTARGMAPWDERLLNRMLSPDDAGAWSVVEAAMASGVTPQRVYTTMIAPALTAVGEMWEDGDIDVAQEHAASQVAAHVIARLGPMMMHRGVRRGTIIVGSTQTERHDLPLAIIADLFRAQRFDVIDLGANLPPESFAAAVARADDLVAVAIGITTRDQEDEVSRTVSAIRSVSDAPILLGGGGVGDAPAPSGVTAVTRTADDALAAVEGILLAG